MTNCGKVGVLPSTQFQQDLTKIIESQQQGFRATRY